MSDFEYVSRSHSGLTIKHTREGHQFNFYVVEQDGQRILSMASIREGNGDHAGREHARAAMDFATIEARRLGIVD